MDSKAVFAIRKEAKDLEGISKLNKLIEAFNIAQRLFSTEPYDDWIQKAFAYTLIDLIKYCITDRNLNQAGVYFNQLLSIDFQEIDEIIENQKNFLRPKIDTNYSDVQKAEVHSKNGNNIEALAIFKNLISQNRLTELHHESYGWIIYRYIKAEESNLSSVDVRTFLRDYMNLKNERPSMLHSMVLNFALNYSKTHKDFNFYNFFLLWNPDKLRHEDLRNGYKEGKDIPSLISRICKEFVNSKTEINIEEFLSKINLKKEVVLDFFRETIFWNVLNAQKENKFSELWNLFEQYNINYSKHGQSKWHSEILNLAERFMKENDELRFLNFFRNWNPENLRIDDWKETKKDEHTYKPLAIKAIKKAFEILKTQPCEQDLAWLLKTYENAIKLFPEDEWLLREKAILHFKNNELDVAIKIYKQLVLELSDKHYLWQEFSACIISDNPLKIGMLSKALSLEKNEDFLGDIHLDLAKALISETLFENAFVELEAYKKHREIKGWRLSSLYEDLMKKASAVNASLKDNWELYKKYIQLAENFAYADLDWTEVVLADKWKDDKGKDRLIFTDGKTIDFAISKNRFEVLKQSELGQILKFKIHKQQIKREVENRPSWLGKTIVMEYKYIPLIAVKSEKKHWEILEDSYAIVDYINKEKNIIHAITCDNKEVFFPQTKSELQIGDFLTAKTYTKKVKEENRTELRQIKKLEKDSVISKFQTQIAIVDGVNEQKQLFHFVISPKLQGIVKYTETNLRPCEGDFIRVTVATKTDKKDNKNRLKVLNIELTDEKNPNLFKEINGNLRVKIKNWTRDDDDLLFAVNIPYITEECWLDALRLKFLEKVNRGPTEDELTKMFQIVETANYGSNSGSLSDSKYDFDASVSEMLDNDNNIIDVDIYKIAMSVKIYNDLLEENILKIPSRPNPDFAFIDDLYVPKYLLEKHKIRYDCQVKAKIIYAGDKWKVIEIERILTV
jgi:hypothetical protein